MARKRSGLNKGYPVEFGAVTGEVQFQPPETAAERASRLRREEAAERFGHIKETVLLVVVCAIGVASLVGAYAPWLDVESRNKAHTLLAMIASGAGTYLFSRPTARAK
jgi:uncharacterized membrane protein YidH (DUF202 family)